MRVPTGQYRIDFFNKFGERLRGESLIGDSIMHSHKIAKGSMPLLEGKPYSYTVMRCVFNSLDKDGDW